MHEDKKASQFITLMRSTKAPKAIPKLARDAKPALLYFQTGEEVDRAFQDGLIRHFAVGSRGTTRHLLMLTLDAQSAGEFAMTMCEAWEAANFNGRYEWVLDVMGKLGDDRVALKMEGLIASWQYTSDTLRKRAISAMRVFRLIDSPTALMALVGLTHRQDVPTVYEAAVRELRAVASQRHMGWHDLSDAVIPDCGLDARGTRAFELGVRTLSLALDAEFEPILRDEAREVHTHIPDAQALDDPQKVEQAKATWALMQAQLHDVIRIQTRRMEEAMITGRMWPVPRWREVIMAHPLMTNFARRLVWGRFDEQGDLLASFRASVEDATLIDVEDEAVEINDSDQVGLLHPIQMTQAMRQQWADSFADYEVFAPFDQLGRQVFDVPDSVGSEKKFVPDQSVTYTSRALREVMKREGWRRETGGGYTRKFFYKAFEGYEHVMYVDLDPGLTAGGESWDPEQHVEHVRGNKIGEKKETPVMVKNVPAVCFSEALRFISQVEEFQA